MRTAKIASLRCELPEEVVSDAALAATLGVEEAFVASLSRGRRRYHAPDGKGPADYAAEAVRRILTDAGVGLDDIDFVLFSTTTPDIVFPGSACLLQGLLEMPHVGCLDLRAHCAGFVVALDVARRFVATGTYDRVLVATGEVPSHVVRFDGQDPELACMLGDAAAVALVEAGEGAGEILSAVHRTDGRLYRQYWCESPASRRCWGEGAKRGNRLVTEDFELGRIYPVVDFVGLRESALEGTPALLDEALDQACIAHVDAAVVCHMDPRVEDEIAERIAAKTDRVVRSSTTYAFASALPLAFSQALESGEIERGQTVALVGAGSGVTWSSAVVRA